MTDKMPVWLSWLFSTPPWVPAAIAVVFTVFLVWINWPQRPRKSDKSRRNNLTPLENLEVVAREDFSGKTVVLDGKHFKRCDLIGATLVYNGDNTSLTDCQLVQKSGGKIIIASTDKRIINFNEMSNKMSGGKSGLKHIYSLDTDVLKDT